MPGKNTLEHVKSVGKAAGLILLDEEYVATDVPMRWLCVKPECGCIWKAPFRLVSWGRTCPACKGHERWSEGKAIKAAEQAKLKGFELVKVDMDARQAHLLCPAGHELTSAFCKLRNCKCSKCAAQKRSKDHMAKLVEYAESKGGAVLATSVDSPFALTAMKCARGHEFSASFRSMVYMGSFCPKCGRMGGRKAR